MSVLTQNVILRHFPRDVKQQRTQLVPPWREAQQVEEILLWSLHGGPPGVAGESVTIDEVLQKGQIPALYRDIIDIYQFEN